MNLPPPQRGSVIRYAYLWADEDAVGREQGRKDRPVLVLGASVDNRTRTTRLLVLAITHSPTADPHDAIPVPREVESRLGLDELSAWIVTTEANAFTWPGPDIRPIPGCRPTTVLYGRVPDGLLRQAARSFLANRQRQRSRLVPRTE